MLPPVDHSLSLRHKPIVVYSVAAGAEGGALQNTPTASSCTRALYLPEAHSSV